MLCVTTIVDVALLTMSHATASWKSKSQCNAAFRVQWAPSARSIAIGLGPKYFIKPKIVRNKMEIDLMAPYYANVPLPVF